VTVRTRQKLACSNIQCILAEKRYPGCFADWSFVIEASCVNEVKGKGEVRPRTGHEGPDGEWWYNSTLSLTSLLDGLVLL
jgi:hypothetical protein